MGHIEQLSTSGSIEMTHAAAIAIQKKASEVSAKFHMALLRRAPEVGVIHGDKQLTEQHVEDAMSQALRDVLEEIEFDDTPDDSDIDA